MDNQLIGRLYDAIDDAVNETVDKAGYNRTIQATIVKCIDATIGKYQCKYQDSNFYAYSEDANTTYIDGSSVYVLVPNNDLNGNKQIIGSVKKLGINYIRETEEENFYDINGTSCINSGDKSFGLKSYKKEDSLILYDKSAGIDKINVNQEAALEYIKTSTSLMIEATIQTKLDKVQQFRGNYGIRFILDFENNSDGATVTKEFCLDVDKLSGNPYKLINPTRQYAIFDIDYDKFQSINKIEIYSRDFPNQDEKKVEDIFFSNINIFGTNRMSQSEINGCSINFIFPQGTYFDENNKNIPKKIKAQVKLKGIVLDPTLQDVEFYWYKEDVRVTLNSEYYNSWGGRGWKCLNQKTIIQPETENEQAVVEWIPTEDTFEIAIENAVASENVFKCAIKYDSRIFSKTFVIKNRNGQFSSKIEAAPNQEFYYDVGSPTLTCVTNPELDYEYNWAMVDNDGLMTFLPETTDINESLQNKRNELQIIEQEIEDGIRFQNASQDEIDNLKLEIDKLERTQRVDGKYLYSLDLTKINQQATYKCSIYSNETYLGTSSIVIKNTKEQKQQCRLVINNGNQVFKYTEDGVAPTNKSLANPIDLKILSYTIYDENGDEVPFEVIEKCQSKWKVPIKKNGTMLTGFDSNGSEGAIDEKVEYQYYNNATILSYKILDKFDYTKNLNDIYLTVNYNGVNLYAATNFTFTKQGDIGTNGTNYVCKIELNTDQSYIKYPIIHLDNYNDLNQASGKLNFIPIGANNSEISGLTGKEIFKVSLYNNGEKVEIQEANISWKILQNKYSSTVLDESYFNIEKDQQGKWLVKLNPTNIYKTTNPKTDQDFFYPANLFQCQISYNGMNFYDVMPVFTCFYSLANYNIELKEHGGFEYALYSSDGRNPKYNDDDPFEIIVNKKINGIYEDVSLVHNYDGEDGQSEAVEFEWTTGGQVKRKENNKWIDKQVSDLNKITLKNKKSITENELDKNKRYAIPPAEYDGECLTHCIFVNVKRMRDDKIVGKIHIPIYLLLNRYGIASINQWDGNSVQIDEDGGYILAPQIGAGKKDNQNRFTGVLMGEVREANRETSDVGLLGYNEGEKTFFINAETGSTILGKKGTGRLVIDTNQNQTGVEEKALIYSDNFWKDYDSETGLPKNYNIANERIPETETDKPVGMLINLTDGIIKSGIRGREKYNFSVDDSGHLTSNSATIGGFTIDDITIRSNGKTSLSSGDGIYLNSKDNTFGLGSNFRVDSHGNLTAKSGTIADFTITIGRTQTTEKPKEGEEQQYHENVGKFYSGNKHEWHSIIPGIYLDSVGRIRLGYNFLVDENGHLTSRSATLGGFTVGEDRIYSGKKNVWNSPEEGIFIGSSGAIQFGLNFEVSKTGRLIAKEGKIGGWQIGQYSLWYGGTNETNATVVLNGVDGTANFNNKFTINNDGTIAANSGKIGGWKINSNSLTAGNMYLNNDGSCGSSVGTWSISSQGVANFSNFTGTGNLSGGFSGDGSGTFVGAGGGYGVGSTGLYGGLSGTKGTNGDIMSAISAKFNELDVLKKLSFKGSSVAWRSVMVSINSIEIDTKKKSLFLACSTIPVLGDSGRILNNNYLITGGW